MKKINWGKKFSVNVSIMDEEHKLFILISNKLIVTKQKISEREIISDVLNEMTLYALSHFKNEEEYMKKFDYPEYHQHKKEHKDFLMTIVNFCKRVTNRNNNISDGLFEYLEQWLAKHIQGSDKKYTECFNENGLF